MERLDALFSILLVAFIVIANVPLLTTLLMVAYAFWVLVYMCSLIQRLD
jgi:hypothetical protein